MSQDSRENESSDKPRYFSMIPHIADDDLNLHEYRLYGHYVKVCGMRGGTCEESMRELASKLGIGKTTLTKTRDSLLQKGYIRYKRVGRADAQVGKGETYVITISDKWSENEMRYCMPDLDAVPMQERSPKVTVPIGERSVPIQERTVPNQEQKDQEVKREEAARPAAQAGTPRFQMQVDSNNPQPTSKPPLSTKLAEYIEATTKKTLTTTQRSILAKKVQIHSADGTKTEYPSPEDMYVNQRGFSHFVTYRVDAYKRDNWSNLTNMVKDIANYGRNKEGGQPGWLAWKDKRLDLTAPLPNDAAIPAHEKAMLDAQPEITGRAPSVTMFDDDDIPEAVIGAK